jgi:protection of telomeres protein 1
VRLSALSDIINNPHRQNKTPGGAQTVLPFVCARYRARVRVVDFKPDILEDFAQPIGDPSYDDLEATEAEWDFTPKGWEWAFCLLAEDALSSSGERTRIRLIVDNDGAEHLLKMDATEYVYELHV